MQRYQFGKCRQPLGSWGNTTRKGKQSIKNTLIKWEKLNPHGVKHTPQSNDATIGELPWPLFDHCGGEGDLILSCVHVHRCGWSGKSLRFRDAAGIWLEQLRDLSGMGGPGMLSILLGSPYIYYNTNTSLLLNSIYTYESNFHIIFHNGTII